MFMKIMPLEPTKHKKRKPEQKTTDTAIVHIIGISLPDKYLLYQISHNLMKYTLRG